MTEKDKGIRKALQQQPSFRLSSNFTYRMMQQIEEQARRKEKRMELRLRAALVLTVVAGTGLLGWFYGQETVDILRQSAVSLPDKDSLVFYLPIVGALVLLFFFNRWMRRKYAHLLS